jgi:hypothetical protein
MKKQFEEKRYKKGYKMEIKKIDELDSIAVVELTNIELHEIMKGLKLLGNKDNAELEKGLLDAASQLPPPSDMNVDLYIDAICEHDDATKEQ